ncbi:MAG: PEP-CTERM sorting domain-containing protein [Hormoscilla sp.]
MDRTIKKIITAAATAAAATMSVATVATSPATAATFTYSGTDARLVGFSFENPDWNEPSDIYLDRGEVRELGLRLDVFLGDSYLFFDAMWDEGSSIAVYRIENTDPYTDVVLDEYTIRADELDVVGATSVPEPSSAIALMGVAALGAVASKRRRRS